MIYYHCTGVVPQLLACQYLYMVSGGTFYPYFISLTRNTRTKKNGNKKGLRINGILLGSSVIKTLKAEFSNFILFFFQTSSICCGTVCSFIYVFFFFFIYVMFMLVVFNFSLHACKWRVVQYLINPDRQISHTLSNMSHPVTSQG